MSGNVSAAQEERVSRKPKGAAGANLTAERQCNKRGLHSTDTPDAPVCTRVERWMTRGRGWRRTSRNMHRCWDAANHGKCSGWPLSPARQMPAACHPHPAQAQCFLLPLLHMPQRNAGQVPVLSGSPITSVPGRHQRRSQLRQPQQPFSLYRIGAASILSNASVSSDFSAVASPVALTACDLSGPRRPPSDKHRSRPPSRTTEQVQLDSPPLRLILANSPTA